MEVFEKSNLRPSFDAVQNELLFELSVTAAAAVRVPQRAPWSLSFPSGCLHSSWVYPGLLKQPWLLQHSKDLCNETGTKEERGLFTLTGLS